jgi:modulator of FtsH protease
MDAAYDPGAWHDFGVAFVSAGAALLGLVFVVVSLHVRAVVDDPVLRHRTEIILGLLATTLTASAALLIPGQSREALGLELMPIALAYITLSSLATFRATHSPQGISRDRLARFFVGLLSTGLIFVGGLGLLVQALGGSIWWERASSSACSSRCSQPGCSSSASGSTAGTLNANGASAAVTSKPTRSWRPAHRPSRLGQRDWFSHAEALEAAGLRE